MTAHAAPALYIYNSMAIVSNVENTENINMYLPHLGQFALLLINEIPNSVLAGGSIL